MIYKAGSFTTVPTEVLLELTPYQQLIMVWLCHHANKDMSCFPSYSTLVKESKLSRSTIIKTINELAVLKLLEKASRRDDKGDHSNIYQLNINLDPCRVTNPPVSCDDSITKTSELNPVELNPVNKKNIEKKSDNDYSDEFEEFMSVYPSRSGNNNKQSAWRSWKTRLKEGSTAIEMIEGTNSYMNHCVAKEKVNTEFVMMMSTFLGRDKHFLSDWDIRIVSKQRKVSQWDQDADLALSKIRGEVDVYEAEESTRYLT